MDIKLQSFRISCVLNSIFFPLTSTEIFDSLRSREFGIGRPPVPIPTGPRVYVGGPIARKSGVVIHIDENRNLVRAHGNSIEDTLNIFSEILEMLEDDYYLNLEQELNYVELIAHCLIKSDSNPFEILQNSVQLSRSKELKEILGTEVGEYRISIVPKGVPLQSRDWFEINISPKLTMPTKAYFCEVIFRNEESKSAIQFAQNLNSIISRIIETLEGS